jgi:TonB family protein
MRVMKTNGAVCLALIASLSNAIANEDTQVTHLTDDAGDRQPLHTVVPVYPESARRERVEGDVQVCFNVDREGRTSRVRVRTSTHRVFEKPAKLALSASTYKPLAAEKKVSGIKTCRTFRFRLIPVAIERPADAG